MVPIQPRTQYFSSTWVGVGAMILASSIQTTLMYLDGLSCRTCRVLSRLSKTWTRRSSLWPTTSSPSSRLKVRRGDGVVKVSQSADMYL